MIGFVFNDGGRKAAGYRGQTSDCVTRAIAIATGLTYDEIYDLVNEECLREKLTKKEQMHEEVFKSNKRSSARTGVRKPTTRSILIRLGWRWVATMKIGQGCKVHLRANELPKGRLLVQVSKHLVAVIDGVIHDTHNCSRGGTRCVYGYWLPPEETQS